METLTKPKRLVLGGEEVTVFDDTITCYKRQVIISIPLLKEFTKSKYKRIVGRRIDTGEILYIWEDEETIHVGCCELSKLEFSQEYQKLILSI